MAIAPVQKIQVLAHESMKMEILSSLQEEGLVHLEKANFEEEKREVHSLPSSPGISQLENNLQRVSHVLDYLSTWEEKGMIKKLFTPKPKLSKSKRESIFQSDYLSLLDKVEELEKRKNDLLSEIKTLTREIHFLSPYTNLDIPLHSVKPTQKTEVLLSHIPLSEKEALQERSKEEAFWFEVVHQDEKYVYLIIIYPPEEKELFESLTRDLNLVPVYLPPSILKKAEQKDKVRDVIKKAHKKIEDRKKEIEEVKKKEQELTIHREKLMFIHDVLLSERQKLISSNLLGETDRVFYLEGWIRSSDIKKVKSKLKSYSEYVEVYFRPPLPEEEPPVILENPRWGKPFEMITKLYGLPQHKSLDPTLSLAPFFFIFVGLCVSEAGYGILAAALSIFYIKHVKPQGSALRFFQLLFLLAISTVILGTLIGGWFGFPLRSVMIFDPVEDPLTFLALSLVLGFIQVWFGTLLKMVEWLKNRQYLRAIFSQGGWLVLLPSGVLYFIFKEPVWGYLSLGAMGGIVFFSSPSPNPIARFFGGLYSLYDISRYLADILSYSRLLALGLATSVIAMVVNTLAQNALGIPVLGWVLAALIFIIGHLFNFGISYLGGFVHSMRLQFVEFFSKFFQSGGKSFQPLELKGKFVDFIE